ILLSLRVPIVAGIDVFCESLYEKRSKISQRENTVMTMELLELRLRSLERRNARLKLVVLLVAVLAVGAILTNVSENLWADTPAVQDTVRANRIEVVDTDGKLLAVLGKLTGDEFYTTAGLSLISNEKQVAQLAQTTYRDGSSGGAELRVFNPKDEKQLFSAG